ncbi:MAG: putative quinol monooxygenase [Pseudomonadales bacterium]|nr:putative quinol monooxygenase [Pseudomonadales bacterium]MDP7597270.1 putative quinol monooxygenase [Pseudomonadales bacterium]HJN50714.1 putative quinol monooxygenase [Pseudomonadales bacterium]
MPSPASRASATRRALTNYGIMAWGARGDPVQLVNSIYKEINMAIGVIAKLKIQEGKNSEFEGIFQELAAAVRANEAGNNFYALHKSRSDPQLYIVLEQYVDQAALDAHGKTDHFRSGGAKMGPCMGGAPEIEVMDAV